jgi:hypothetical protein
MNRGDPVAIQFGTQSAKSFRESAGALTDLAADPRHLGGELGMTGILQRWTRDLTYHPHIHYLVPGGALTSTGWVRPKHPNVLVPRSRWRCGCATGSAPP